VWADKHLEASEKRIVKGYQFDERLGQGAFGVVYRATQLSVGREVAIKAIRPVHANRRDFIQRFENEAQLVARLEHPHIVPLFDYWREPNEAYLVMRYLRAGSLRDRMNRGPLSNDEILAILNSIASALDLAHRRGVIHRDVKPENILLDADQNAYLTDFGIAEKITAGQGGGISGSPGYISPEQIREERPSPQMDIYSLGIMLYEIVGGRHPYAGQTTIEKFRSHAYTPLPTLVNVLPLLNRVILQAASKDPAARQASVIQLFVDFQAAIRGEISFPSELEVRSITVNPYKGLRSFTEADASVFFGRERLVKRLIARLREDHPLRNFLAVVGPSGSGKSSVVAAGLLPALRKGAMPEDMTTAFMPASDDDITWQATPAGKSIDRLKDELIVQIVPGSHPLQSLEAGLLSIASQPLRGLSRQFDSDPAALLKALREIGGTMLLVIDQFEEVFTLTDSERERSQFLELLRTALIAADSPLRLVITLRADFTDRPLHYVEFGALMGQRTEFVLPLSAGELERAIAEPARRVGLHVDPKLIATIVQDVQGAPGALPLLQYALTEAFDRRTGQTITLGAYEASGGVYGALARRAQEVYDALDADRQSIARHVFLRLVTLGEGVRDTRRRVRQSELLKLTGDVQFVLDAFSKYRLIAFDVDLVTREPMVELAHEALLRAWVLLQEWLDASRTDIRLHRWLAAAVGEWEKSGRDHSYLLSGTRLAQYEDWRGTAGFLLTDEEVSYLDYSSARRRAQQEAEHARQAREQRKAVEMQSLALTANSRQTSLQNLPDVALALCVAANLIPSPPDQSAQLLHEVAPMPGTRKLFMGHKDTVWHVAVGPSERYALSGSGGFSPASNFYKKMPTYLPLNTRSAEFSDNTVQLWDLATGEQLRVFAGHANTVTAVAFSPDERCVISASADATIRIWDKDSGRELRALTHPAQVLSIAIRGELLLASDYDFESAANHLILWNWQTGREIRRFGGQRDVIYSVAISPDGRQVLSGSGPTGPFSAHSGDNDVVLWDLHSGEILRRMQGHKDAVFHVAFRPDGRSAVSSSADSTLVLWNLDEGKFLSALRGHTTFAYTFAISPRGDRVFSASFDLSVILWDVDRAQEIRRFYGHSGPVTAALFLSDGRRVLTGAVDKTIRLWDIYSADEVLRFGAPAGLGMWAVASDGQRAITSAGGAAIFAPQSPLNLLQLWDLRTGELMAELGRQRNTIFEAALLPDGKHVLTVSGDFFMPGAENCMILREVATGREVRRYESPGSAVSGLALLPDGKRVAAIVFGDEVVIWNIGDGTIVRRFTGAVPGFRALAVSRDGQLLLAGSALGILTVWNLESGEILHQLQGHSLHIYEIGLTSDSAVAVTVSNDTTAVVWDLERGEQVLRFQQHATSVQALALHPRQEWVLTGDDKGTLLLWELRTGKVLRRFPGHTGGVWDIAFIRNGDFALTTGGDGNLIMWKVAPQPVEDLVAWTRENRHVRDFTSDERKLYRVEEPDVEEENPASVQTAFNR
jgi:WD40 repeat protein/serine/threonine protein kinase